MVVYIGYVDVRSALHHCRVVICCSHGGASFFSPFHRVAAVFLPSHARLCLLLLQLLRLLFAVSFYSICCPFLALTVVGLLGYLVLSY